MTDDSRDMRVGDIVVSPRRRQLVAGGHEIGATPREFDVFAAMAAHPGWVYSADQLCSAVPELNSSPGAVNVHISHLRRKLSGAGFPEAITTVRGAGYKIGCTVTSGSFGTGSSPFVGRAAEMSALSTALRDARGGRSRFALVTGEPGIGKTALVERSIAAVSEGPVAVVRATCDPDGSPQYWLWRQLVLGLPASTPEPADWDVVHYLIRDVDAGEGAPRARIAGERAVSGDAVLRFLGSACGGLTPVVLFIDDLHWADESSLSLLGYVLKRMDGMRLCVAATCREEQRGFDQRIAPFIAGVCGNDNTVHLRLLGLDPDGVAEMAEPVIGEQARDLAGRIHSLTGGNPLFVRELVQAIAEQRGSCNPPGMLDHMPATIDAVVCAEIAGLPEVTRRALDLAAVVGVEFDVDVVDRAGQFEIGIVAALDPAIQSSFIVETGTEGRLRFRHPVFRRALYERLPASERERAHAAVYAAIRGSGRSHPRRVFDLATHSSRAGVSHKEIAVGCLAAAERESSKRFTFEDAARFAESALQMLEGASLPSSTAAIVRAVLFERLGESRAAVGDCEASVAAYEAALRERRGDALAARARLHTRIAASKMVLGEWNGCRSSLDLADECLETIGQRDDAWWLNWIHCRLQRAEFEYVAAEECRTAIDPVLASAVADHGSPTQFVSFLEKRAEALWARDRFDPGIECVAAARQAAEVAATRPMEYAHARAVELLGGVLTWHRDLEEAEGVLSEALELVRRHRDPIAVACVLFFRAVVARFANDVGLTGARAQELLEHASRTQPSEFAAAARGCLAWVALRQGDQETSAELARQAIDVLRPVRGFPHVWTAAWPLAVCALAKGCLDEAASCASLMLGERQERQPDVVTRSLEGALRAHGAGDANAALVLFSEAAAQSALLGYA